MKKQNENTLKVVVHNKPTTEQAQGKILSLCELIKKIYS